MINGTALLNRRYAVGHSKEEALERYEKLKHLQRKVVNGFAMVEISKGDEKYELTIPEATKILQVVITSYSIHYTKLYDVMGKSWRMAYRPHNAMH